MTPAYPPPITTTSIFPERPVFAVMMPPWGWGRHQDAARPTVVTARDPSHVTDAGVRVACVKLSEDFRSTSRAWLRFGLLAFGARQLRSVPGYSPPVKFRVAIISVVRADDPAIVAVTEAAARPAAERGHAPPGRGEARPLI